MLPHWENRCGVKFRFSRCSSLCDGIEGVLTWCFFVLFEAGDNSIFADVGHVSAVKRGCFQ